MTTEEPAGRVAIALEDVSVEMRAIAAEADAAAMARRFLGVLQAWAAPSAVLCLAKDVAVESGWRTLSELTQGSVTPAFERSIVKLIEDSPPGALTRPVSVRPRDEVAGTVKVRENWLVPWAQGDSYGYVFLRGVARSVSNLGEAVALVAQPLWARLAASGPVSGTPHAAPIADLVEQAQRVSDRLAAALRDERERLSDEAEVLRRERPELERKVQDAEAQRAAAHQEMVDFKTRLAELERRHAESEAHTAEIERERQALREESEALKVKIEEQSRATQEADAGPSHEEMGALQAKLADLETRLDAAEAERAKAAAERDALRTELEVSQRAAADRQGAEQAELKRRVEDLSAKVTQLEKQNADLVAERDDARTEGEGLRVRLAAAEDGDSPAAAPEATEARERIASLESALAAAHAERDAIVAEQRASSDEIEDLRARVRAFEDAKEATPADQVEDADPSALAEARVRIESIEKEHADVVAERDELRARLDGAQLEHGAQPSGNDESQALQERIKDLETRLAAAEEARSASDADRDSARSEVHALRALADSMEEQAQDASAVSEERDRLKERVAEIERELAAAVHQGEDGASGPSRDQPAVVDPELQARLSQLEEAQARTDAERDAARAELETLRGRLEGSERDAEQARAELAEAEDALRQLTSEFDESRRRLAAAEERASALESQKSALESDRDRAKAESNRLWQSVESLQRQLAAETGRLAELANSTDQTGSHVEDLARQLAETQEQEKTLLAKWSRLVDAVTATAAALRRTPFVPPTLRVAFSGVEEILNAEGERSGRPASRLARVLFLDRDTPSLERLASELETGGIEVLVAHYPEEVGFFLKTPEARRLTAMVCDVNAFRGDQDLLELFRSWRQDVPSLALLLSFKADNPSETEKAQRIPVVMTAGYLTRPLDRQAVVDAVGTISRRQLRSGPKA